MNSYVIAKSFRTNSAQVYNAPEWLKPYRLQKIAEKVQYKLEWSTRRVKVYWYFTNSEFVKHHSLGSGAVAVTVSRGKQSIVHLGPKVNNSNFDQIFAHELVHVIINQKYKGAIPKWLEEGFANHLAKKSTVDYAWLLKQPFPDDVKSLSHPFKGGKKLIRYRYIASQALVEMLEKKCDLTNLLRLSVQRKMDNYIKSYCEIKDLNVAFRAWVQEKAKGI